jgi:hypothetical protein
MVATALTNLEENVAWRGLPGTPIVSYGSKLIGILVLLISVTAITEHPEWFS